MNFIVENAKDRKMLKKAMQNKLLAVAYDDGCYVYNFEEFLKKYGITCVVDCGTVGFYSTLTSNWLVKPNSLVFIEQFWTGEIDTEEIINTLIHALERDSYYRMNSIACVRNANFVAMV